eukprot:SAG31_NODE_788_length_12088_cov_3.916090_7_plen_85_part_00
MPKVDEQQLEINELKKKVAAMQRTAESLRVAEANARNYAQEIHVRHLFSSLYHGDVLTGVGAQIRKCTEPKDGALPLLLPIIQT